MRAYLFSDINKKADRKESRVLWFCDMQKCGGEVEIFLPAILQYYCGCSSGRVFFGGDDEIFLKNTVAILGNGEVCIFPKCEIDAVCRCDEFVSGAVHIVYGYRHFAVISCGGENFEVDGWNFEFCDCVNFDGRDYIFLKFENRLVCVLYSAKEYSEFFNIPATSYAVENGICEVTFAPKISAGAVLYCEINLSNMAPDPKNLKFSKFKIQNGENFNFHTFENYFFELLLACKLLESGSGKNLICRYLESELHSEIAGVLQFLGDFCGIVPVASGGVILIYQCGENQFETRKFEVEVRYNQMGVPTVENISEIEDFQLENDSFEDISKFMITI